jgi:hypothetical protein
MAENLKATRYYNRDSIGTINPAKKDIFMKQIQNIDGLMIVVRLMQIFLEGLYMLCDN